MDFCALHASCSVCSLPMTILDMASSVQESENVKDLSEKARYNVESDKIEE